MGMLSLTFLSSYLIEITQGIDELWIDVQKQNGIWKSKGLAFNAFKAAWAPGEPKSSDGFECAYISRLADYKMKADFCKTPKKYICMAVKPNCPEGYTWLPAYGQGRSCFKIVGSDNGEFNVANKLCLKDKTRLATPMSSNDTGVLSTWIPLSGSLSDSGQPYTSVQTSYFSLGIFRTKIAAQTYHFVDRYIF